MEEHYNKQTPIGIKILSILNYIFAGLFILLGPITLIAGIFLLLGKNPSFLPGVNILIVAGQNYNTFGLISLIAGIVSLFLGIFMIFIGIGLWRGRKWARISEIILSVLWIIAWSIELFRGSFGNLVMIVPALIIISYLLFSKKVRIAFQKNKLM